MLYIYTLYGKKKQMVSARAPGVRASAPDVSTQIYNAVKSLPDNVQNSLILKLVDSFLTGYEQFDMATHYIQSMNEKLQLENPDGIVNPILHR